MISIKQNLQLQLFLQKFNMNSSCYDFEHNFVNKIN